MGNDIYEESLKSHAMWRGKIEISGRAAATDARALSLAYTPGVAEPCRRIAKDPSLAYDYTRKWNTVAVVTDGSAVLGLGNIGPTAALPVMEGKALLFREFGGVDAMPICLDTQNVDEIVRAVELISPGLGGINLEDISAPRCFEIERRLDEKLDIPVFHDDQHGTAVVVLAALTNACTALKRDICEQKVAICGAGAAGLACAQLLYEAGIGDITMYCLDGVLHKDEEWLNDEQRRITQITNPRGVRGKELSSATHGADVFIGVSAPRVLTGEMVRNMSEDPIIFAMANPEPEILPAEALSSGAAIVGTGRSDYPNQINNVLAFPGIFRGALDARARSITSAMKRAAAEAIASMVKEVSRDRILPNAFDPELGRTVSRAVARAAVK